MKRLLALFAVGLVLGAVLLAAGSLARATPKPTNPLVIKTAKHGTIKIVRAVVGGRLYVIAFVFKQGVWFLVGGEPAVDLPGNPRPNPKS